MARKAGTLVQLRVDGVTPPLPFNQIQCADLSNWSGQRDYAEWRKVTDSVTALVGREATAPAKPDEQEIQYCKAADGVRIAYARVGKGSPLLKTANWLNHLEYEWDGPVWGELFRRMSADHTLVRYDERGHGLSDWNAEDLSLEAYVQDMEAVVDAAGLERFPIFAISQGGSVAIEYAARHPERVSRMILLNAFLRARLAALVGGHSRQRGSDEGAGRPWMGHRVASLSPDVHGLDAARPRLRSSGTLSMRCNAPQPRPPTPSA